MVEEKKQTDSRRANLLKKEDSSKDNYTEFLCISMILLSQNWPKEGATCTYIWSYTYAWNTCDTKAGLFLELSLFRKRPNK